MPSGVLVARDKKADSRSEQPSGGGKKKKKVPLANAKLAADLVHKLGVVSQWRQKTVNAILDPHIRQFIEMEFELAVNEMNEAALKTKQQRPEGS